MSQSLFPNCELHKLVVKGDERGSLIALEAERNVPFPIARVYYIFGTQPGAERGFHAHRDLYQLAVCVRGSCAIKLDDGRNRQEFRLDRPDLGLQIGPLIWREMREFSEDAVLMVLASAPYDEADYIRDYDEFVVVARQGASA